jgi:hypothetical protein
MNARSVFAILILTTEVAYTCRGAECQAHIILDMRCDCLSLSKHDRHDACPFHASTLRGTREPTSQLEAIQTGYPHLRLVEGTAPSECQDCRNQDF